MARRCFRLQWIDHTVTCDGRYPGGRAGNPACSAGLGAVAHCKAEQGEVDLAFHTGEGSPPGLRRHTLFTERYVLAGRVGHPRLRPQLTLAEFCELEHVIVSPDRGGFHGVTDEVLAKAGLKRKVVLSVPSFLFMMSVLASTDLVAMLPSRLVRHTDMLQIVDSPVDVPGYEMVMLWHERSHRDPAHQWLRETIAMSVCG